MESGVMDKNNCTTCCVLELDIICIGVEIYTIYLKNLEEEERK